MRMALRGAGLLEAPGAPQPLLRPDLAPEPGPRAHPGADLMVDEQEAVPADAEIDAVEVEEPPPRPSKPQRGARRRVASVEPREEDVRAEEAREGLNVRSVPQKPARPALPREETAKTDARPAARGMPSPTPQPAPPETAPAPSVQKARGRTEPELERKPATPGAEDHASPARETAHRSVEQPSRQRGLVRVREKEVPVARSEASELGVDKIERPATAVTPREAEEPLPSSAATSRSELTPEQDAPPARPTLARLEPRPPSEAPRTRRRAESGERRPVEVRIGTIEIRAAPPAGPETPAPPGASRPPPHGDGFATYDGLRRYHTWRGL